tara:strand:+ start:276 stop:557 length:282 start_codon:yes stop_codon:yes gene_type:complete
VKIVLVQPLRLPRHITRIRYEYQLQDVPETTDILTEVFKKELSKPIEEMNPVFLDLIELLLETLSSYGVQLDFFALLGIQPADECKSLLIKVL